MKRYILQKLAECYLWMSKDSTKSGLNGKAFIDFLNKDVRTKLYRKDELYAKTVSLENLFIMADGKYDEAINNLLTLKNIFSSEKLVLKNSLFQLWYINYNITGEKKIYRVFLGIKNKVPRGFLNIPDVINARRN